MTKEQLFIQYRETKNINLRNQIVEKYLYMVDILIKKYLGKGVDYDDLYQVGSIALVSAVERYDIDKGFEFTSFATPTILGEIKRYFRDKEWSLKVPRRLKEIGVKIPKAKEELSNKLLRKPTVAEIAEHIGFSEEEVLSAMESNQAYATYSLNQTFDESGEDGESTVFEKYTISEEKGYGRIEYYEIINSVLKNLNANEKYIFEKRFVKNRTQAQVAKALGVSQMTVSRAEKNIKNKFYTELQR